MLIRDEHDPFRYAEVRGEVTRTTTGPEARKHIDEVAHQYLGTDYPPEGIKPERVILWVTPQRQTIVDQTRTQRLSPGPGLVRIGGPGSTE